jgi:ligand-binding sensor domain-containing protein/signal transduction histidine kinase
MGVIPVVKVLEIVLVIIIYQFIFPPFLYPQTKDLQFEHITELQGLSANCISCILQDSKGFMWFGTENGLNRYDGYEIIEYKYDPDNPFSLSNNFIRTIYEDPADSGNILWIGTEGGGLNKFDRKVEQFTFYQTDPNNPTSLSDNKVKCIYKDNSDVYWIGTEGGGLNKFNRKTGEFFSYKNDPNDPYSLSAWSVFSICEDYLGNLWLGTAGGLNRFNPHVNTGEKEKFICYYPNPNDTYSLPSNLIFAVYEDKNKILWIGTRKGLRIFDREMNRFICPKFKNGDSDILNHGNIWSIFEDSSGELWIATHGGGLVQVNAERDKYFIFNHDPENSNSISGNRISSVYEDKSGVIWIGTYCYGINKLILEPNKFIHYKNIPGDPASLSYNWVSSFCEDSNGDFWVGTIGDGLNKFSRDNRKFVKIRFDSSYNVSRICETRSRELWIAREEKLTRFNPKTGEYKNYSGKFLTYHSEFFSSIDHLKKQNWTLAAIRHVENNENISRVFEIHNPSDVLIVATGETSANIFVDYGWLMSGIDEKLIWKMKLEETRHAGGDFRNRIQASLITLLPGKYQMYYKSNSNHGYKVWTGYGPDNSELWGIFIFSLFGDEKKRIENILKLDYYGSFLGDSGQLIFVYEDQAGALWCIMRGGELCQFDRNSNQFIHQDIIAHEFIYTGFSTVYEDHSGTLWFGTDSKGLIKRIKYKDDESNKERESFIQYKKNANDTHSISSNSIKTIYEGQTGVVWIGTDLGLNKFDPETESFTHYREKDGLPSDLIMGILEDDQENLWISTNKGLSKFNPIKKTFKNFDVSDGLQSNEFSHEACYKSKSGEMFFGGINGFNTFYPESIKDNPHIPSVVITDFQLFNKSVSLRDDSPLKKSITETQKITLSYNQDVISFEFAALDFTNPVKNKYAYNMEGVDPDWVYTDASRRFANYTRLEPGEYIFRVKGSNNDGVWNEEGTSLRIIIIPPWWQTGWAYGIYLFAFIALVVGIIRLEVKRHKRKLETRLREEQEHRRIDAAEHRASLAELQARTAEAEKETEKEQIRSRIASDLHDEIGSNLSSIALIGEMLDSKLSLTEQERKSLQKIPCTARATAESMRDIIWFINPENDSMAKLLVKMRDTANLMLESIDFTFTVPKRGILPETDLNFRRNLYMIFKECLQNIIKHARAKKVEIEIRKSKGCLSLSVSDNGSGFDTTKIYNGDGLKNIKRRAAELVGTVDIKSAMGNGTTVTIAVKIP